MPGGHRYVKPVRRTTAPQYLLVFVPEIDEKLSLALHEDCQYHAKRVWATVARRYGTRWVGTNEPQPFHPDDWWAYVKRLCGPKRRMYVVSPTAADDCTVTAFWRWVDRGNFVLADRCSDCAASGKQNPKCKRCWSGRFVTGNPPDIIHMRCNGGTVTHVSLRNYTEVGWDRLANSVRLRTQTERPTAHGDGSSDFDGPDRCCIATRYVRSLISEWVRRDCGPWKDTVAQLSVSWWRRSFYTVKVCRHDNETAIKLEKEAAHGGRAETWYYGDCGDRARIPDGADPAPTLSAYPVLPPSVYRCDISAQYPAILATEQFPIRLMRTIDNCSVADLKALLKYYGVIANVELRTDRAEYPVRVSGNSVYPVGRFVTTLAGPDISLSLARGEVTAVRRVAIYQLGEPLRDYARHLLRERATARERLDFCGELFAKSLATAIGGKFSQRTSRRELAVDVVNPFSRWGPYYQTRSDGTEKQYITIAGACFHDVPYVSGGKLLAALYCYLTAYGRCQMRQIREAIYPCIPYSQDTDGIWVGETGLSALRRLGLSADRTPGKLRLVSEHVFARWITPRHYYVDGRWTLSGYHTGSVVDTDMSVVEIRDINPVRTMPWKAPAELRRKVYRRQMASLQTGKVIGDDGWLVPQPLKRNK